MDQLPDGDEVLGILRQEHAQLNIWVNLAVCKINNLYFKIICIYNRIHQVNFSVLYFSLSTTSSRRLKTLLRYLNLLVLMQMLTTETMKKIRCELWTCWLPIMSRKPIERRIKTRKETSSQKLHCCTQRLTKSSCMTRYVR